MSYPVVWDVWEVKELYDLLVDIEATNIVLKVWQLLPAELRQLIEDRCWEK